MHTVVPLTCRACSLAELFDLRLTLSSRVSIPVERLSHHNSHAESSLQPGGGGPKLASLLVLFSECALEEQVKIKPTDDHY